MNLFRSIANIFKRKASAPYDGAGHGKRLGNWYPSNSSINTILASNLSVLRNRARDIVRKNPYASNAIDSIVANCIGTGIKPQSKAKDADFRRSIQEAWLQWTDLADYTGTLDFYGLQALVLRSVVESGECFVRFKIDKNAFVPLKLQVLESEHLDCTKNIELTNGNIIRSGIEFDKKGNRVAYHLFKEHPGDASQLSGFNCSLRIPASEILHIFKPLRPGQIRGEPWLSNVLLKLHELDQYEDAELVRKKHPLCLPDL